MQGYFALNKIDQPISENKNHDIQNDKKVFFSFYKNFLFMATLRSIEDSHLFQIF